MAERRKPSSEDDDILEQARKDFDRADENESDNRTAAEEDIKFARLGEHWPEEFRKLREAANPPLPCLTIPILSPVIRQVVNDARQNKPQIKVSPVDDNADVETADIYSDLIRNIETQSNADVAYDTGIDSAVTCGIGYWRIVLEQAHEDSFDVDIAIKRVLDPFSIYGDPDSLAADSSDWNVAFVVDWITKKQFETQWNDAEQVDWDAAGYSALGDKWVDKDRVLIAEYWTREEVEKEICLLNDGTVISKAELEAAVDGIPYYQYLSTVENKTVVDEKTTKSWKVTQRRLTGAEVLDKRDWPGKYIPIVPVYGDEVFSEGKRHFRSLTRDAMDAQRNYNYWRSQATALIALAPRVPFIGPEGSFAVDKNWANANSASIPYLEYGQTKDGTWQPPQRQPLDTGPAAGMMQEAMMAGDDVKRITGIYDASLGARSNEISGKAIMARQREGDVSTFHFLDNQKRAIRHTGRVVVDLIPHVYSKRRIIRVRGEDGKHRRVDLTQPVPKTGPDGKPMMQPAMQQTPMGPQPVMKQGPNGSEPVMVPMTQIVDLAVGKYDVEVQAGPSFTTRREEAAAALTEAIRSVPPAAPVLIPEMFKMMDFPGADEISEKLEALAPKPQNGPPPEMLQKQMQEMQKQLQQGGQAFQKAQAEIQQLQQQLQQAKMAGQSDQMNAAVKAAQIKVDAAQAKIAAFEAETNRWKVFSDARLDAAQMGMDMQLALGDLEIAHTQAQQHGLDGQGAPQAPPPPPPSPIAPVPMQGPGMMAPPQMQQEAPDDRRFPMNGPPPQQG